MGYIIPSQVNPKPQRPGGIPPRGSSWDWAQSLQRAQGRYRGGSLDYEIAIACSHRLLGLLHQWCGVRTIKKVSMLLQGGGVALLPVFGTKLRCPGLVENLGSSASAFTGFEAL